MASPQHSAMPRLCGLLFSVLLAASISGTVLSASVTYTYNQLGWLATATYSKAGLLPADNTQLGVAERRYVANVSKAPEPDTV